MTAETTLRIAKDFQNVIAIKEASGNITQMDDIIKNKPANFDVISMMESAQKLFAKMYEQAQASQGTSFHRSIHPPLNTA